MSSQLRIEPHDAIATNGEVCWIEDRRFDEVQNHPIHLRPLRLHQGKHELRRSVPAFVHDADSRVVPVSNPRPGSLGALNTCACRLVCCGSVTFHKKGSNPQLAMHRNPSRRRSRWRRMRTAAADGGRGRAAVSSSVVTLSQPLADDARRKTIVLPLPAVYARRIRSGRPVRTRHSDGPHH
jgi:hypothetical protein